MDAEKSRYSVVLPVYITKPEQLTMTLRMLKRLKEVKTCEFELVIVETVTEHLEHLADVYVREVTRPISRSTSAINKGFRAANGKYVVLISNDVFVQEGWLEAMEWCFTKKSDCGAATVGTTEHANTKEFKIYEYNYWPVAMLSQKTLAKVGLMDEEIWGVWNDTDYLMRMYRSGIKMYQNRAVVVEHLRSKTEWVDPHFDFVFKRNEAIFYNKHVGAREHEKKFTELYRGYVNRQAIKGEGYDEKEYIKFVHDCKKRSQ